jgi:DNA-binding IclR family transcriptional regulator
LARSSQGTSAISRVLSVLDAFTADSPFLTLTQISRRTGYPVSSTHRIVRELLLHGLLEPVAGHRYRVGNRLWEIGSKTPGALGLREIAQPYMHALHRSVGQHVQLGVRLGTDVLVIERISARNAVVNATIVGGRIPLQHSSSGLVLLAHAEEETVQSVLRSGLRPATADGLHTEEQLRCALDQTRRRGYAVTDGFIYSGSRGIAVPVRGAHVVVGALGVVVANDATPAHGYAETLMRTATDISRALLDAYLPRRHSKAFLGSRYRRMVNSSESSMVYLEEHTAHSTPDEADPPPIG